MIPADLLPRGVRRRFIDRVYGAEDRSGVAIYLGGLWFALVLATLFLTGTPWNWAAVRDGRVESLTPLTCEAILDENQSASLGDGNRTAARPAGTKGGSAIAQRRNQCRQLLSEGERAQFTRTEQVVSYLRLGGVEPPAMALDEDSPMRSWVDGNICRLGGADAGDRPALAWYVQQGIGECGGWSRTVARLPLAVWMGPILGVIVTPLILLALLFMLGRHTLRLPSTRRAYRRLYGSEHKAP